MKTTLQDLDRQAREGFEMVWYRRGSLPLFRTASGDQPWDKIIYGIISEGRYMNMNIDPMFEDKNTIPLWELLQSIHWALTQRLNHEIEAHRRAFQRLHRSKN